MLRIRLQRPGKSVKGRHHFKIIVNERQTARDGRFTDELGHYDPSQKLLKIDTAKYQAWLEKGAKPTETVVSLFKRYKKQAKN